MVEEELSERDDLAITLVEAARMPKKGELEQLISSELALAVFSKSPLQKIRHVFEAYFLLSQEDKERLFNEGERVEIERLYEVCISFLNTVMTTERCAAVCWSFPVDNASNYLYWVKRVWIASPRELEALRKAMRSQDEEERNKAWSNYLMWLASILSDGNSPLSFVRSVASEFIVYCQPIIAKIMRTIFTSVISRDAWRETVQLMRGAARRERV